MAHPERLLQRLRSLEDPPPEREAAAAQLEAASIIEHLQRLLNTRQGSAPIRPDYGIPDFSHLTGDTFTDIATEMQRNLKRVVETFEPRLAQVQVGFDLRPDDRSSLRFRIEAVLARDTRVPLTLDTALSPDGRLAVLG